MDIYGIIINFMHQFEYIEPHNTNACLCIIYNHCITFLFAIKQDVLA